MAETDERTRLLTNENRPHYCFNSSIARERKKRIKQFQCFLCTIFICFIILSLIISIIFSINANFDDNPTSNTNITNDTIPNELYNLFLLKSWPLEDVNTDEMLCQNNTVWEDAILFGKEALDRRDNIEKNVPELPVDSPSYRHQIVTSTSEKALQLSRVGYVEENGTKYMHRNNTKEEIKKICPNNTSMFLDEFCQQSKISCNVYEKYRSFDGTCNNLKYPTLFGAAYRSFRRAIPPVYEDGISSPRISKSGQPLPSARTVSLIVHRPFYRDDIKFTVMLAVFGQFLDHDITATALSRSSNGNSISCCINESIHHPECFSVIIDDADPLRTQNITCMEFVRSAPAPTCCLGPREQMNQVTGFIDGSVIYGVEPSLLFNLRTMQGGLMKMFVTTDNRTLLPISKNLQDGCNREEARRKGRYCFEAGDSRSNENLHLTSMHTLWVRHHNQIAENLSKINPHWNDDQLFQECRKIIGAEMQHIAYKEFLPILLGTELMTKFDLNPKEKGYFHKYNESVDPTVANNFATAAFRFAHTIIPGVMKLLANYSTHPEYVQMHKMLFNPFKLYEPGEMDRTLRGAMNTNIEANDPYFNNELKQHLFERNSNDTKKKGYGLDLVALNIQRGRDHGLPGYPAWRKHCGLKEPRTFDDLSDEIDSTSLENIKSLYRDVSDIDLYTGALCEKPLNGSMLGPTLTCLILDQFIRLKYGDRYWYENPNQYNGFTPEQINEIRKSSLAKIICDCSDNVRFSQPLVMERVRPENENVPCEKIPRMNLNYWKDSMRKVHIGDNEMNIENRNNTSI